MDPTQPPQPPMQTQSPPVNQIGQSSPPVATQPQLPPTFETKLKGEVDIPAEFRYMKRWVIPYVEVNIPTTNKNAAMRNRILKVLQSKPMILTISILAGILTLMMIVILLLQIKVYQTKSSSLKETLEKVIFGLEIAYLVLVTLFLAEAILRWVALGCRGFCCQWWRPLDFFICIVCFGAAILLVVRRAQLQHAYPREYRSFDAVGPACGLLIFIRIFTMTTLLSAHINTLETAVREQLIVLNASQKELLRQVQQNKK